jgi:hypothetical protein
MSNRPACQLQELIRVVATDKDGTEMGKENQ